LKGGLAAMRGVGLDRKSRPRFMLGRKECGENKALGDNTESLNKLFNPNAKVGTDSLSRVESPNL